MNQTKLRLIPALIAIAFSGSAAAAGFQLIEQNASGIGNSFAGSAVVAENASTIFYNPAGMTQLRSREVSVGMSVVKPSFNFTNNGSSGTGTFTGNGSDGGSLAFLPNAYLSWALTKDLYLGLGMGAPFGLMTEYDSTWLGSAHSIKFDIKTYNLNPSVAYRVNDWLSLGAGINYMIMEAEYVKRAATLGPLSGVLATLKADDAAWGWNVGAIFKLSDASKLGVSYRSKVKQNLEGDISASPAAFPSSAAKAALELPDIAILSLTHKLNSHWELLGDVSWTGWSSIPKVDIVAANPALNSTLDTAFEDSWRVALGANYQLNNMTKLKFGVAYDQTPVPDAAHRLVSLPDNDRTWLSLGAQWRPTKDVTLDVGGAYLFVKDTEINNVGGLGKGTVKGDYDSNVWILGAQLSMAF